MAPFRINRQLLRAEVYRQAFWLGLFEGATSPKRLAMMSNSPMISGLDLGRLTRSRREQFETKTTRSLVEFEMILIT